MAEARSTGKITYVTLSLEDVRGSKRSDNESEDTESKKETVYSMYTQSFMDDYLIEFSEVFRRKVRAKYCSTEEISWSDASDEVKVEILIARFEDGGRQFSEDPLLVLLKKWPASETFSDNPRLIEAEINRLVKIIFCKDEAKKYKFFKDKKELSWKTPLHLVAELNFTSVAQTILSHYPGQLYITTNPHAGNDNSRSIPLKLALKRRNDEVSTLMIEHMGSERVLRLFSDNVYDTPLSFQELVKHPNMKKTVTAVLNCMISPDWRHLPKFREDSSLEMKKDIELAWSSEPSDPISYQFSYKILDGDESGRDPTHDDFDWMSKSCLFLIANSGNKEAIQHPVVRRLVKRKWINYGHFWFSVQTGLYLMFLLLLSFSLLYGATKSDPTKYQGSADGLRMVCEIFVVVWIAAYIADEVNEIEKKRWSYLKVPQVYFNLFDWLGLILILSVIPLRFSRHEGQWVVASVGFIFNVLRLFKYSCVTRATGLYTKTLARIVYRDITRFSCVFLVVFLAFCGAFFLSLRMTSDVKVFGGFDMVMLSGVRAFVEQQPAADDYTKFKWLPMFVLLTYMMAVVVILLNILIAQISSTYCEAKKNARLQYDVDRMLIITRLEHSRFHKFNLRLNYYQEEEIIDEMTLAKDLLEYNEDRSPWETVEEKLDEIRAIMRKIIKRIPLQD